MISSSFSTGFRSLKLHHKKEHDHILFPFTDFVELKLLLSRKIKQTYLANPKAASFHRYFSNAAAPASGNTALTLWQQHFQALRVIDWLDRMLYVKRFHKLLSSPHNQFLWWVSPRKLVKAPKVQLVHLHRLRTAAEELRAPPTRFYSQNLRADTKCLSFFYPNKDYRFIQ